MKKEYLSTIEEVVDAHFRIVEIIGTLRKLKWMGLIGSISAFVVIFLLVENLAAKLIIGSTSAVLFFFYHLSTYKGAHRKRIRRIIVKALGTDQSVPCEYEINQSGLTFRQLGQEVRFSWDNVRDLNHKDGYIEIIMTPTSVVIIPNRIFEDSAELREWIKFIRDHVRGNHQLQATF